MKVGYKRKLKIKVGVKKRRLKVGVRRKRSLPKAKTKKTKRSWII